MKAIIVFLLLLLGSYVLTINQKAETIPENQTNQIAVFVQGAVEQEGEYRINQGDMNTLFQTIELTKNADCSCINMERELYHEDIVYIPSTEYQKISLNQAGKEELMSIKGIGEVKADKIIEYRSMQPFISIEDIMKISGIGYKTYLKWRDFLCL